MFAIFCYVLAVLWGIFTVYSWFSPSPKQSLPSDSERDRQIGLLIGSLGGGIEEAAVARYAISRLEEDLGRQATLQEITIAIGATYATGDL